MTKKHHPHNRAERLALKQELDETKPKRASVWRKLTQESLKDWESKHELEQVADYPTASKDH